MKRPDSNPKSRLGMKKPPLQLVPPVAVIIESMAFKDGAEKYGAYNWRRKGVAASVYIGALLRHVYGWWDGEELSESRCHHLAHARACLAIILDAASTNTLIDDRPAPGGASELITKLTEKTKRRKNRRKRKR